MSYEWIESLESGNVSIDTQHRELFQAFNDLFDACARGEGRLEILRTLTFLEKYMLEHLDNEETLMRENAYPDYAAHKSQHNLLRRQITSVLEEYRQNDINITLVAKVNSILSSWVVRHVQSKDVQLAGFLRGRN